MQDLMVKLIKSEIETQSTSAEEELVNEPKALGQQSTVVEETCLGAFYIC